MARLASILQTYWARSQVFRAGILLLLGGGGLDGFYHVTTALPLPAAVQSGLFPVGSLSHVLVILGIDIAIVGAARSRRRTTQ